MKEFTVSMTDIDKMDRPRFRLDEQAEDEQQVPAPTARALRKELFSDELIDDLLLRVGQDGLSLTGKGGAVAGDAQGCPGARDGRRADLPPGLRARRPGRARVGQLPQREHPEDGRYRDR